MARVKELKTLSIQEAMDNLATIVGIDMASPPKLGVIHRHRYVTDAEDVGPHEVFWLSGEGSESILEILDMTYYTIHQHLVALLESSEVNWDDPKVRKGIQSMLALVEESAHKMDEYLAFRLGKPLSTKVEERIPYQDLLFFYQHRFSEQMKGGSKSWSQDFDEIPDAPVLEISKTGLMDFETVRRDQQYELFSIRNENGDPYFNEDLLRNIKLVCFDAESEAAFEDDPLLKIRAVEDRDLCSSSTQILSLCQPLIADFYKLYRQIPDLVLAKNLSYAIMALQLAANPRNLIQNTANKSSFQYFHDFHIYLRRAMNSPEYQKFVAYPPDPKDKTPLFLLHLTHALSFAFFHRLGGVKAETIALIHRCMRKGEEKNHRTAIKGESIWSQMLIDDEKFRSLLGQFPSGPLFKILDQIRETEPELVSFDPIDQGNLPQKLFEIHHQGRTVDILRMPCPVRQAFINKASIVEEFLGFLRYCSSAKERKKHLLINLQDRTSWQEYARSLSIESLQKNAEFGDQLIVATLPKSSDFYYQYADFMNLSSAQPFISAFKKILKNPEENGFFFPPELSSQEMGAFMEKAIGLIHREFFMGKKELTRRNREDFIEIFYQMLILKWIEIGEIDSISFTCKDSVDTGAAQTALFFGFMQIISSDIQSELDFLRYLFYAPAFFVRERVIDPERLNRAVAALELSANSVEENDAIYSHFAELYHSKFLKSIEIKR